MSEEITQDTSDGYHTFRELYDHRCLLFLCWMISDGCPGDCYWVPEHYDGWDLVCCEIKNIGQISYHVPIQYRRFTEQLKQKAKEDHVFDGHTSDDVITRMMTWLDLK